MIYLILPLNRNKLDNSSVSKLLYKYFNVNMNRAIIIAKLKTMQWIMLQHGIRNAFWNRYNTTIMIKLFISA